MVALSVILRENTIPRSRDCYPENPGYFPGVREVFRESGFFSESPGSFPRVWVALRESGKPVKRIARAHGGLGSSVGRV